MIIICQHVGEVCEVVEASGSCEFQSDLVDCFIAGVLQPQVDHGVLQRPAHVELQRQIIHPLHGKKQNTD